MSMSQQPVLPGFPVPPLPLLEQCHSITRTAILQLKHAAVRCGSMEVAALASALEAADDGDVIEAADALDEAERMREIGA
jgi:hypothetical protein